MSDYPTSINLCDGKYTIIYDFATGQSECLRYGQPWRQLVGDKMVLACFDEIVRLSAELAKEREKVKELEDAYDQAGRTIQVQGRELIAAESRLHEVATHCANKEEQLAAAQATIEQMREALTECRSSVKFDLTHYEKMARAYGNLGAEGKQTHEVAENEADRLHALMDRIDALALPTNQAGSTSNAEITGG